MTSFIRTIQRQETDEYVEEILSRSDHFIPLKGQPQYSQKDDYIYLLHNGLIIARAKISRLEPTVQPVKIGSEKREFPAGCLVWYKGGWEKPKICRQLRGFQGIRYLDTLGLENLDRESWK